MNSNFAELFTQPKPLKAAKGQVLVQADETPRGVGFIMSGYVKTYHISNQGEYQLIAITGPNEIFPLYWALDTQSRDVFFEALCDIEFKLISKEEFKSKVMDSKRLLKVAVAELLDAYVASQQRIRNLEFRTARERLVFRLLYLAERFGKISGNSVDVAVPVIYQDLADALNLTRETVNRTMSRLIKDGLVTRTNHHLIISKLSELKDVLGDEIY